MGRYEILPGTSPDEKEQRFLEEAKPENRKQDLEPFEERFLNAVPQGDKATVFNSPNTHMNTADRSLKPESEAAAFKYAKENNTSIPLAREIQKHPELMYGHTPTDKMGSKAVRKYLGKDLNNAGISSRDVKQGRLIAVDRTVNNKITGRVDIDGNIPLNEDGEPVQKELMAPPELQELSLTDKTQRAYDVGRHNLTLAEMRFNQIMSGHTIENDFAVQQFKKRIPVQVEGDSLIEDFAIATSSMTPLVFNSFRESVNYGVAGGVGAAAAAALASGPAGPITVPVASGMGYAVGSTVGATRFIYQQEVGLMYDELLDIRDENGRAIDKDVLKGAALFYGAGATVVEVAFLKVLSRTIPGGEKLFGDFSRQSMRSIIKNSTAARAAFKEIGKKLGAATVGGGLEEGVQQALAIGTTELAKYYAEKKEGLYFLPFNWKEAATRVGEDAYFGALGGLGLGTPGSVASGIKVLADVNSTKKQNTLMNSVKVVLDETETKALAEDKAEEFIDETALDEESNIQPDKEFFQEEQAETILNKLGVNLKDARKKLALGQTVNVPNSKILAQLTDEEYETVTKYLTPNPTGYSEQDILAGVPKEEAEQLQDTYKDILGEELEFTTELDRIKKELITADLSTGKAEDNTAIVERFANGLALQGDDRTAFLKSLSVKKDKKRFFGIGAKKKGSTKFFTDEAGNETAVISLFQKANASTAPHEFLHTFVARMEKVEALEGATDLFKNDMQALRAFAGVEKGVESFTDDQNEKLAKAWEKWLFEGKAPNESMKNIFARFHTWLKEIYKHARAIGVNLTPEVRQVFNRMLDAEAETETTAAIDNMVAPTKDRMNDLGIQDEEQFRLKKLHERAIKTSELNLLQDRNRAIRDNKIQFTKDAEREAREADVQGVYSTIDGIQDRLQAGEVAKDTKFSRQEFIAIYGEDQIENLPAPNLLINGGIPLNQAAYEWGFESGDQMMGAFLDTVPLKDAIDFRVALKNETLEATFEARDYLAKSDDYSEYIARIGKHLREAETRAIQASQKTPKAITKGKQAGTIVPVSRKTITAEQARAVALDEMLDMSVTDSQRVDRFMSAMRRASIAMAKAERKQDYAVAIKENEKMLLNHEMAKLASRNKTAVRSFIKRAEKFRGKKNPATVSIRFRKGVQSLIQRFSVLPNVAPSTPVTSVMLKDMFKGENSIGEFVASPFLLADLNVLRPRDYRNIAVIEFQELDEAIQYLTKQGKVEHGLLLRDGKTRLDDVIKAVVPDIQNRPKVLNKDSLALTAKLSDVNKKAMSQLLGFDYAIKILGGESLVTGELSELEKHTSEPLKDSRDAQHVLFTEKEDAVRPHAQHLINLQRELNTDNKRRLQVPGVNVPEVLQDRGRQRDYFTAEQVVSMAANLGSQSNLDALLSGYPGLTMADVLKLVNKFLTVPDMQAIQGIMDIFDTLKHPTNDVFVKMKGFDMTFVEAKPFTFKGMKFKGGYWPIAIDRNLTLNEEILKAEELATALDDFNAKHVAPYSDESHTNERKGHKLPISLSLALVYKHLDRATRYITQAEVVRDVNRIITNKEFKLAVIDAMGKDKYRELQPSLRDFATPRLAGHDVPGNRNILYLRKLATASNLALRAITAPKQLGSISGAIHDMGKPHGSTAQGFKAYMGGMTAMLRMGPGVAYSTMTELSPYMDKRGGKIDRDFLRPKFQKMTPAERGLVFGDREVTWDDVVDLGFAHIKLFDRAAVTPIWWGSYLDRLNETGTNEREAVRYADNIIQGSQPNVDALTLPAWLRKGGFYSLFNLHQTFTVGIYGQRQRAYYTEWKAGRISNKQYAMFNIMDSFIPVLSIQIMVALLRGRKLDDEETWHDIAKGSAVQWLFMGVPIVNAFAGAIANGWRDIFEIPGAKVADDSVDLIRRLGDAADGMDQKERSKLFFSFLNVVSDFSRVPVGRLAQQAAKDDSFRGKIFGTDFKVKREQSKRRSRKSRGR